MLGLVPRRQHRGRPDRRLPDGRRPGPAPGRGRSPALPQLVHYSREATGRRRPTGWKVPTAQGTFSGRAIEFDAAGRVTHEELVTPEGSERRGYAFDGLGRLSKAVHLGGRWPGTEAYAHDALGNLTARTTTSGLPDRTFEQDPQDPDRLCRVNASGGGPCELTYDGAGNVVADLSYGATQPRHLAYDAGGRITSITRGPYGASMTYGPAGRATLKVDGFHQRTHFYFGGLVEVRYLGTKAGFERRIPGPGGVVATRRLSTVGDTTVYHHGDGRANRVFTDAAGQLVQQVDYTSFGQAVSTASGPDSLQSDDLWNGGDDLPELGLVLLGPRAYDPDLGRFLQRDPIAITARASTANPYAFSFSDPVNFADPSGLSPEGTRTWQQHQQAWGPMAGAMAGLFWLQFSGDIKRRSPRPTRPASAGSVPDVVLGGRVSVGVGVESTRVHLGTACGRACKVWRGARAAGGYGVGVARGAGKGALRLGVRAAKVAACPICVAVDDVMSTPEGVRGVTQLGGALVDDPVGTVVTLASDPELAGEVLLDAVLTKKVGPGVLTRLGICRGGVCPCFTAGTPVRTGDGSAPIETLSVGQRVPPDHAACQDDAFDDHVAVQLEMDGPDGDRFDIVLLRHRDWLAAVGAEPGATIWVALTELNVEGPARVLALDPTVTVPDGPGCPITGTIRHLATSLVVLTVEGSDAPINATPQHPFYSVDRDRWVAAGDLHVGELVATETGTTRITSSGATSVPPTDVYNLEVHGAHEYFVHDAAVRVHNNYAATTAAGGAPKLLTQGAYRAKAFAQGQLDKHFAKHAAEWGAGNITKTGYLKRAQNLLGRDVGGDILGAVRKNGDVLRYNARTNEFAVGAADGTIRTLFRPQAGMDYWQAVTSGL